MAFRGPRRGSGRRTRGRLRSKARCTAGTQGLQRPCDGFVASIAEDEHDRHIGELWDALHKRYAVGPRQHQVEQDQVED